ncbi:hypothetical protein [Paenibacillus tuaregi]|uniref:hypothetical protein n=1 Tax=Paenibacillus tuaregi TaxID=1816681 RepID=UPI0009EF5D2E|nr:hypothetical protein [Paenibacillus tuaregi]
MTARLALMSNGWTVATTDTDESFDIVARDPVSRAWKTFQVKTIKVRTDRRGDLVVNGRKGNGEPYTLSETDYFIGVMGSEDGGLPTVYVFENNEQSEYWATETSAERRWVRLPIELDRATYAVNVGETELAGPTDYIAA